MDKMTNQKAYVSLSPLFTAHTPLLHPHLAPVAIQSLQKTLFPGWTHRTDMSISSRPSATARRSSVSPIPHTSKTHVANGISDDHLHCFTGPCSPAYHSLPEKTYRKLETRVLRASEFFGSVVVPFILSDLKQFFVSIRRTNRGIRWVIPLVLVGPRVVDPFRPLSLSLFLPILFLLRR